MSTYYGSIQNWISQAEAARIRGVTRQAISRLVARGRLPTLIIGGRTLISKAALLSLKDLPKGRKRKGKKEQERANRS